MKKQVYVLLGDVVGSRRIKDRASFEKKLSGTVQEVNRDFAAALELPLRTWKGLDEVAAVLKSPATAYAIADRFNTGLAPGQMRLVLAGGVLDRYPEDRDVTAADGAPFHVAAGRMLELKREGLLFHGETGRAAADKAWNTGINLLLLLKSGWTERQRLVYAAYCRSGRQEEVADSLGVSQQMVSKTLRAISAAQVGYLEKELGSWAEATYGA